MVKAQMENFLDGFYEELHETSSNVEINKVCCERISNTIVIENFHTASLVFVPEGITIDLEKIIYESGYLFACGESVFSENIEKTEYKNVWESAIRYMESNNVSVEIRAFTDEAYPWKDREYEDDYKDNGVVGLQINPRNFYMKDILVQDAIREMNHCICQNTDKTAKGGQTHILWLSRDLEMKDTGMRDCSSFYFLTKILIVNKNSCYLFDTDHPAWNNTLIPHSFVTAMLNICRGSAPKNRKLTVLDPFVGSGTMAVEAAKFHELVFYGGDKNPNSERQVMDNLSFFAMGYEEGRCLAKMILIYMQNKCMGEYSALYARISERQQRRIEKLSRIVTKNDGQLIKRVENVHEVIMKNLYIFSATNEDYDIKMLKLQRKYLLEGDEGLFERIFLYTFRKAFLRHCFHDSSVVLDKYKQYFFEEIKMFFFRLMDMLDELEASDGYCSKEHVKIFSQTDLNTFLAGWQKDQGADIIITDPPYGYNTVEEDGQLYKLYYNFVEESVKSINDGGQVIVCLASRMNHGKRLPEFIKREFVLDMFRDAAYKRKMQIVELDEELCHLDRVYQFPFFWESKKVLRREILRLQFVKNIH